MSTERGDIILNIQATCDAERLIFDDVARWPGSTHDSFIWRHSGLKERTETGLFENGFLIGDSGYPLTPSLLTPVDSPKSDPERQYNRAHKKTRVVVERLFGELKSRFRCLHNQGGALPFRPEKAVKVVVACACLHNMTV